MTLQCKQLVVACYFNVFSYDLMKLTNNILISFTFFVDYCDYIKI